MSIENTGYQYIYKLQICFLFHVARCGRIWGIKHDDVIKWKHHPCYWPFARGIHRSPVNHPHKGQWRGALVFSVICAWMDAWVNKRAAGDLRRHRAHYDVIVMKFICLRHRQYRRPLGRLSILYCKTMLDNGSFILRTMIRSQNCRGFSPS